MQTVRQLMAAFQGTDEVEHRWVRAALPLAIVALAAVAGLWMWQQRSVQLEPLLGNRRFSDMQVAVMADAFQQSKLTGYAIREGQVLVPRGEAPQFLAALAKREALPPDFQSNTDAAFSQNRFLESDRERQLRIRHAREKDLALALRSMQGIENAMVQYDEVEKGGFQREKTVTACVAILPSEGHVMDRSQIRTIRQLVAWARAGMKPDEVNVTDLRSGRAYIDAGEDEAAVPLAQEYLQIKRALEQDWLAKVRQVLRFVPAAEVVVDVELVEPSAGTRASTTNWSEPKRIAISVGVPESYLREVRQANLDVPARADLIAPGELQDARGQVEQRIRGAIAPLLPDRSATQSAIAVTIFADPAPVRSPLEEWRARVLPWLSPRHLLAGLVVWSMLLVVAPWAWRARPQPQAPPTLRPFPDPQVNVDTETRNAAREEEDARLRSTLAELVRQDPDRAAQVLQRWLDRAG